ncbi:MAG: glycoside hydrolase family 68 protein [Caulobacteraceae bacterium]|nr:glycoside hydrolase family 68 protein [Caulobacter sp.]
MTLAKADPAEAALSARPAARWTADEVRRVASTAARPGHAPPLLPDAARRPLFDGVTIWDMWPLAEPDGRSAAVCGGRLWFALSAPAELEPDARHDVARILLVLETADGGWRDCGPALPDGLAPGSREWSGSAVLSAPGRVRLFFTAAGRRGEAAATFEQRLFELDGRLVETDAGPRLRDWTAPRESVAPDGRVFLHTPAAPVRPGVIKAWRDPAVFRDPVGGEAYLLFAASLVQAEGGFDGALGIARAQGDGRGWRLLAPLLSAAGVNRELERPHMLVRDGLYYLFWCTQRQMFAPGLQAPTGLYGMVGDGPLGPFRPLNGSGLVLANPPEAPRQEYAWWVTGEGEVTAFVDHLGPEPFADRPQGDAARFGGAPGPFRRLSFDGDRVGLA